MTDFAKRRGVYLTIREPYGADTVFKVWEIDESDSFFEIYPILYAAKHERR